MNAQGEPRDPMEDKDTLSEAGSCSVYSNEQFDSRPMRRSSERFEDTMETRGRARYEYLPHESRPQRRFRSDYGRYQSPDRHELNRRNSSNQVKLNLPKFNGKTRWRTFINQFEAITEDWPTHQKLYHMLASLTGEAADYAFELDSYIRQDYEYLVEELQRRFKTTETPQTCARQFYRRRLRSGETLKEFASDLKTLVRKAYPSGLSQWAMQQMLIKQFLDGLGDDELRYNIEYVKMPKDLDEAIDLVYEHDDFRHIKRDGKQKVKMITNNQSNDSDRKSREKVSHVQQEETSQNEVKELYLMIKKIAERLDKLENKSQKLDEKACYKCGKTGHFQRFCKEEDVKSYKTVKAVCENSADLEIKENDNLN